VNPGKTKIVPTLRLERDLLNDFANLLQNLMKAEKKYKVSTKEMISINYSDPSIIKELTELFNQNQLGMLIVISNKLLNIQQGLVQFAQYDFNQKKKLVNDICDIVKDLDTVVKKEKGVSKIAKRKN